MATPEQKPLPQSIHSRAQDVTSQKADPVFGNAGFGASFDFAGKDIDRYVSYGSKTYGKLGYDPFRDNSKFYNQNTDASADIQRAYTGMWKLAGVGFRDTFAFGASAGSEAHKEFDQVMSTYGSTRKGTAGFISNTMLSSGYTVGIMVAIAAEELLLAGATALTGGMAAPATIAEMGAVGAHGFNVLGKAQKVVKGFDKVTDVLNYTKNIENARGVWASTARGSKQFIQKLAPMAETFDFIRNADKLKDLNGLQKSLQGVGALARDARKIAMTSSESKLEGNLARDEFREDLISKWNADKSHIGMTMDDTILAEINGRANEVFNNTYKANLALIYATNAITFDSMFKSFRSTNKLFGLHESLNYTVKKGTFTALEDTFGNTLKKSISKLSWKGTALKTLSNSVEGLQETGQDIISGATKRYSGKNPKLEGKLLDSIYASLGDATLESFASGMLMGTFASPVGKTIEAVNKFTMGGGYRAVMDPNGYAESKRTNFENAQKNAELLTKFFNESGTYSDFISHPLFTQSKASENMLSASEKGDKKTFEDERGEAFRVGLKSLLKSNMEGELLDYLDDLGNHTNEELNQSLGRDDITDANRTEVLDKVSAYASKIKDFRTNYDRIEKEYTNPISMHSLDSNDPEYLEKKLLYKSAELFKEELLFSEDRLQELSSRQKSLYSQVTDNKFTANHVNTILTAASVQSEINSLKKEIASDKEYSMNSSETKQKEAILESLLKMQSSLKGYKALITDLEDTEKVHAEMFEAFNDYRNAVTGEKNTPGNRVLNKKKFELLWDYQNLKGEADVLQEHVNTMSDPFSSLSHINRIKAQLKYEDDNKEATIKSSLEAFYTKKASDKLIEDLLDGDVVFNHNELDDLMERGIMPRKFFNVTTHEQLKGEELQKAYAIVAAHYKELTGKTITASNKGYATKKKSSTDKRTSTELLKEYSKNFDEPISIDDFITKLTRSKYIGNTEKEILTKLLSVKGFGKKNIILTESGDTPIDVNAQGDIVLDVRFSSEDYKGGTISFEYLGLSALLQTYFTNQLNNNADLKTTIVSLMNDAKEGILERESGKIDRMTADNIPVFNNPSIFLSESLNNKAFQSLLKDIESTIDHNSKNLWETLHDSVSDILKDNFQGSLLNRALDLAYLTITDEGLKEVLQPEAEAVVTPVPTEGALSDTERIDNQISELEGIISDLEKQISKTPRLKFKEFNTLSTKLAQLRLDLVDLKQQRADVEEKQVVKNAMVDPEHEASPNVDTGVDDLGNAVVSTKTQFLNLPIALQTILANIYLQKTSDVNPIDVATQSSPDGSAIMANNEFDVHHIPAASKSSIDSLSDEDYIQIEANMQNNTRYIDAIGEYNLNVKTSNVVVEDKTVEDETEDDDDVTPVAEYVPLTIQGLVAIFPTVGSVMSDRKLQNRVTKLNMRETVEDFSNELESLAKEIYKLTLQKPVVDELDDNQQQMETFRQNWKKNQSLLDNGSFLYNGKRQKIQKVDVPFFKEQHPLIMTKSPQEFIRILFQFVDGASNYAKSYKVNKPKIATNNKEAIQEIVDNLFKEKLAASKVISSLNLWLSDAKSPFTIKAVKTGVTGVTFKVVDKGVKVKEKLSQSQKDEQVLRDWYFRFDGDLHVESQAEYLVYDWLRTHKVHPSAIPVKEPRSYTSNSSPYKSFDGIADVIFDIDQQAQLTIIGVDVRDLVDSILANYKTVSSLRDHLVNTMGEEKVSEDDNYGPDMESDVNDSLEVDEESLLEYDKALAEYYQSTTYLISNDAFTGDLSTLSKEEQNLYDLVQSLKKGKSKQLQTNSVELNEKLKPSEIDTTGFLWVGNAATMLKKNNVSLSDTLALYKLVINPSNLLTDNQRNYLKGLISRQVNSDSNIGKVVTTNSGIMRIVSSDKNNITLQLLWNGSIVKMSIQQFGKDASAVLEEGTEYDPIGLDNKLNSENVQDLSSSLNEIFDNFTDSMNEFASLNEVDLNKSITEELNKCK
jgi:hypothetical protein